MMPFSKQQQQQHSRPVSGSSPKYSRKSNSVIAVSKLLVPLNYPWEVSNQQQQTADKIKQHKLASASSATERVKQKDENKIDFYNAKQLDKKGNAAMNTQPESKQSLPGKTTNLDQSRSSTSSTTSEGEDHNALDKKIQSLITQVQKADEESIEVKQKPAPSQRGQNSQRNGAADSTPMIYQAQHQPSAQEIKQLSQQMQLRQAQTNTISPTRLAQMGDALLPPQSERDRGKKTLVLDLDETLVHSSFKPIDGPDIVQGVDIDGKVQYVYVLKRPLCEEFIQRMSSIYEIVMFTASLSKYANPLYGKLDKNQVTSTQLYREHCTFYNGLFVKDMARLGRPMTDIIIIDNSPSAYLFQPENALPCTSWYDDPNDRELNDFVPILEKLAIVKDVRPYLTKIVSDNKVDFKKAKELLNIGQFINPEEEMQKLRANAVFTPQKTRSSEYDKAPSGIKQRDMTHTPQNNSQSNPLQQSSTHVSLKAAKLTSSQSKNTLSQAVSQQQQQLQVLQNSIEQLRQQQQSHQKKQSQIENMKKRLMVNQPWQSTHQESHLKATSEIRSSVDSLRQAQHGQNQQMNRTPSAAVTSFKQDLVNGNIVDKETKNKSITQGYQTQSQSQFSLSDQKYNEYIKSLQKHQKRSGSQPQYQQNNIQPSNMTQSQKNLQIKTNRLNIPSQSSIESDQNTLESSRKSEHPRRQNTQHDSHSHQKRASSAQVRQPAFNQSQYSSKLARPVTSSTNYQSSQHRSSSKVMTTSHGLTQSSSSKVIKLSQQQPKVSTNYQSTPDKNQTSNGSSLNYNRSAYVQSANVTPKGHTNSSQSRAQISSNGIMNKQKESSFSVLQQKNQELRKNYVNYISKIESTNPSIGSQSAQVKSASLKLKDQSSSLKPGSAMNKFITKFEQSTNLTPSSQQQNPSANENASNMHLLQHSKIQMTQSLNNANGQSNGQQQQNKNHLSYSSIYAKLNQANQNFSLSPNQNHTNIQAQHQSPSITSYAQQNNTNIAANNNYPVKPSHLSSSGGHHHGFSSQGSMYQNSNTHNPLTQSVGATKQQQTHQPLHHSLSLSVNNSPAVNLIALQMLKNAQSPYHKQ